MGTTGGFIVSLGKKNLKRIFVTGLAVALAVTSTGLFLQTDAQAAKKKKKVVKGTVSIVAENAAIQQGASKKLAVAVKNASKNDVVWSSSDKKVATVTKTGVVKARAKGKVTIKAKLDNSKSSDTCKVSVQRYKTYKVKCTAYCACAKCNGPYAGQTALGVKPKPGRTIAVDPKLIKLGSKVVIDGKTYRAEDTGGAIKGKRIDILMASHSTALDFGVQYKTIKVYY